MKNLAILVVAMILFSSCVTSQVTAKNVDSFPLRTEELEWWHYNPFYPHFYPKPHWPFPTTGKALPPIPAGFHPIPFHPPPVVTKCLADCKDVKTCLADIAKAFFTRKPAIGLDCCASIQKMDEDCDKTVFGAYHNPFFDCVVKLHCSTKAKSTPSAPTPA
ncbi:unnamed protein product [Arabidopsis thaliana]|uniref:At5g17340 n=1 Tax=Arabidopsis thaliana TaxID=3702 RepID=Q9FYN3_ARATH|nr:Putative membrane lipoprotein [Arabidopsis thaliana]AAY17405.1 At5g17340 [Arabidopsis thaliana]AAY57310.1 At5g17340 [Arabidopsis thaliana]AED92415.1 Putative membrane lipoprotein [Arabidopsis thaliana]BAB10521.1 unnamed protein product [Arabidopsis thaliana]|eukprot:NP_197236.1 Putative membrane lipoprotein [Arabidopsis thaliana]